MSLCRNYPTPSNRMAVMWSLLPIKDSIVLEYGPAGTTHFGAGLYSSFGISLENSLFTTHISEDDIIMGDVSRLEKAILEIDRNYKPKVIFIVASAVIAIISTDIKGVCAYMQEKINARLISFDDGGFGGDYSLGLRNTYTTLIKEFSLNSNIKKEENTYNILGVSAASYRIKSDIWEIQELMEKSFNMKVNTILGLEASINDLENISAGSINLVIRNEALPAAKLLEEKFGIPYIYQVPYGYEGTLNWLEEISNILGKEINISYKNQLEEKSKDLQSEMEFIKMMVGNRYKFLPKATIIGDYDTIIGLSSLCEEFALEIDKKICNHSLKNIDSVTDNMIYLKKEKDKINLLLNIHNQFVLGDEISLDICDFSNTKVCVSFPFPNKNQVATHLPFMGEKGTDYFLEIVRDYLASIR